MIHATKAQLEEIAMGLKDSERTVFPLGSSSGHSLFNISDCLSDGFLDEIKTQGLVVPW
jgi:hypothetical protein